MLWTVFVCSRLCWDFLCLFVLVSWTHSHHKCQQTCLTTVVEHSVPHVHKDLCSLVQHFACLCLWGLLDQHFLIVIKWVYLSYISNLQQLLNVKKGSMDGFYNSIRSLPLLWYCVWGDSYVSLHIFLPTLKVLIGSTKASAPWLVEVYVHAQGMHAGHVILLAVFFFFFPVLLMGNCSAYD